MNLISFLSILILVSSTFREGHAGVKKLSIRRNKRKEPNREVTKHDNSARGRNKLSKLPVSKQIANCNQCYMVADDGLTVLAGYDTSFVWKSPSRSICPNGIVLLMQGCGYDGHEWWRHIPIEGVNLAHALPLESRIASALHRRGYAVAAAAPHFNREKNKCWHENDGAYIARVLRTIEASYVNNCSQSSPSIPFFALGVFKAGFFLGLQTKSLYTKHNISFHGTVIMNSGIWHDDYKRPGYPPVLFVDMTRNSAVTLHNHQTLQQMARHGLLTSAQFTSDPWPLNQSTFYDYGVLSRNSSEELFEAMRQDGRYLWPANGLLMIDPTANIHFKDFKQLVQRVLPGYLKKDALKSIHSPLAQILRKAYGFRETNDEFIDQMGSWFDRLIHKTTGD